jgi:RNA polymerase sigma factor (TIGR02999 family)
MTIAARRPASTKPSLDGPLDPSRARASHDGDPPAPVREAEAAFPRHAEAAPMFADLYRELHRLAARQLRSNGGATLGATTLLHEAYVDMSARVPAFPDRARFFAYASRAMRGLVIDYVRERRAQKRGAQYHLTAIDTQIADAVPGAGSLDGLDDALGELERVDRPLAELVDLRFFCGFTFAEIAAQRGVSERTVQRDWQKARLFLHHALTDD